MLNKKQLFTISIIFFIFFLLLNMSAFMHAYKFTHFSHQDIKKSKNPEDLDFREKILILFTGISNPKPKNHLNPDVSYLDFDIYNNKKMKLNCWLFQVQNPSGIVILVHGYSSCKSSLLKEARAFNSLNYDSLLIDLSGHGDSDGNQTTVGFYEADDVFAVYNYVKKNFSYNSIILYGVSMGAVSILHSVYKYEIKPDIIILECPFSSLLSTVKHRFEIMKLPPSPFSQLLLFWGSIQQKFNGFSHNPNKYALKVDLPVLLMYGENDDRITIDEIRDIYKNLSGFKRLVIFYNTIHELYYRRNPLQWINEVESFITTVKGEL